MTLLKHEMAKSKLNVDKCKELMRHTFGKRRQSILSEAIPLDEICMQYPLLRKPTFVRTCRYFVYIVRSPYIVHLQLTLEFQLIMNSEVDSASFEEEWNKWEPIEIEYATSYHHKPATLKRALRDFDESDGMALV